MLALLVKDITNVSLCVATQFAVVCGLLVNKLGLVD